MALAFLPRPEIAAVFKKLCKSFPKEDEYEDLARYFKRTYIKKPSRQPLFDSSIWNHYESVMNDEPRTTNCCEGFHNALNSVFTHSHPNVYHLIERLKGDAGSHRAALTNVIHGQPEKRSKKEKDYDRKLKSVVENYKSNDSMESKLVYLKRIGNLQR